MVFFDITAKEWLPADSAHYLPEATVVFMFPLGAELYALQEHNGQVLRYLDGQNPMWEELTDTTVSVEKNNYEMKNFVYEIDYHELLI